MGHYYFLNAEANQRKEEIDTPFLDWYVTLAQTYQNIGKIPS